MKLPRTLINFIIDDNLLDRIEDFRFKNRFPTRAAAIKWLLDWALKQKPLVRYAAQEIEENQTVDLAPGPSAPTVAEPMKPVRTAMPSRESMVQALKDQGYEVGEAVGHADGGERILVRSQHGSAWVGEGEELQDLAAARTTLAELSARRAAGK